MSRTRTQVNTQISTAVASNQIQIEDGLVSDRVLEIRGTLKVAPGDNNRQFYFHGGHVTVRDKGGFFGALRPFPWLKNKEGWILNPDGTHKTGKLWCQRVTKGSAVVLSPQDKLMLAAIQNSPEQLEVLKPLLSLEVLAALNPQLQYEEFNLDGYLENILGHKNVQLTFSIPQQWDYLINNIKETLADKEEGQSFSFVLRFDSRRLNLAKDIEQEYQSEEFRQDIPIYPTYFAMIPGSTWEDDTSKYVDPEIADEAWELGLVSKEVIYISRETLAARAEIIKTRINNTGTGKKDHTSILTDIFTAVEILKTERKGSKPYKTALLKFEEAKLVLLGIEERGQNKGVPAGYTEKLVNKANSELAELNEFFTK